MLLLSLLLLAAALVPMRAHAVTQPSWQDMPRACLPSRAEKWVEGKAEHQQPACHCPPSSMCPSASDYAKGSDFWAMTPFFVNQCCQKPACNMNYQFNSGTGCPGLYTTGFREAKFCTEFEANPVPGNPANPAVVAETERRERTVTALNSCLNKCVAKIDIRQLQGVLNIGRVGREQGEGYYYSTNAQSNGDGLKFDEYVACDNACRVSVTNEYSALKVTPFKVRTLVYTLGSSGMVDASSDFQKFYSAVYNNTWRMKDADRKTRAQNYLASNPGPAYDSSKDFSKVFSCRTNTEGAICSTLMLNNGSCSSCLSPGTEVTLADGTGVTIETIKPGDKVKGQDMQGRDVQSEVAELVKLEWKSLTLYRINDGTLTLTADHPILTTEGWRAVDYNADFEQSVDKYGLVDGVETLKVGDFLKTAGGTLKVTSIEKTDTKVDGITYNLRLKDGDSFYANGIVVRSN